MRTPVVHCEKAIAEVEDRDLATVDERGTPLTGWDAFAWSDADPPFGLAHVGPHDGTLSIG
jgi:hypothetical protein